MARPSSQPSLAPAAPTSPRGSISAMPMHEIDPSPVESEEDEPTDNNTTNENDQHDDTLIPISEKTPQSASITHSITNTTTTNILGLTPARTIHLLSSIQKYSTVPPAIYLTMHYTNTALIPVLTQSLQKSDDLLLLTRPYYQSFPLEPLMIFAPIATHILSGIALRIYRRRQMAKRHGAETHSERRSIPWPKLSLTSALGYALYPMLAGHVVFNRLAPLKVDGGSSGVGLRYFAHGIAKHPWATVPGYVVMLGVASWHFVGGAAKYLGLSREYVTEGGEDGRRKRVWRGRAVNGVSALVAGLWIAGGLGVIGRGGLGIGWEAKNWDRIMASVPVVGQWM